VDYLQKGGRLRSEDAREMRRRKRSNGPSDDDPLVRFGLSGAVQKGSPRRTLDDKSADLRYMSHYYIYLAYSRLFRSIL